METYLEFASNHTLLVIALVLSFFLLIYSELKRKNLGIALVEPIDAVSLINNNATIIDLRTTEAFNKGHIVNSKNMRIEDINNKNNKFSNLLKNPILTVCETGMISSKLVNTLRKSGNDRIYGLKGGIISWNEASLPLVSKKKTKSKK